MPKVVIDSLPRSGLRYRDRYAIVVVDVIRFSTTATTGVAFGRDIYPVSTTDDALELAERLENPLLAGEQGGNVPYGFHLTNSPVLVSALSLVLTGSYTDKDRPIILVSSSGTRLYANSIGNTNVYVGCLRNLSALTKHLTENEGNVAILGAGTRGAFRREDQIGCAWIAERLANQGFEFEDSETESIVEEWRDCDLATIREGRSANYLMSTGQTHDLEYVLHHVDDVSIVPIADPSGRLIDVAQRSTETS